MLSSGYEMPVIGLGTNAIEESLRKLNIGYLALMLLHHPRSDDGEAYKAIFERAYR